MFQAAAYFSQEHPKTTAVMCVLGLIIAVIAAIADVNKPEPPPIVWTEAERAMITECVRRGTSASWCAYQVEELREVLK